MELRKIKFRGRTFNGTIWAYGLIEMLRFDDGTLHYYIREYKQNGGYTDYEVDPKTIGQFTGLYDKNGKEIYEGDLLKVWCLPFADAEKEIAKVTWDEKRTGFILLYNNGSYHYFYDVMESEVIGNIHDTRNY